MTSLLRDLKTRRFWRHFLGAGFATFGALAALAGLIDVLFKEVFEDRGVLGALVIGLVSAASGLRRAWPRPIEHQYSKPDTKISVVRGNLLEETGHLVVGMCDTFDTEPPDIIATSSLQAQVLNVMFAGNRTRLDGLLDSALTEAEVVGTVAKAGKQTRYELGTVAVVPYETRRLFMVAYTTMNSKNVAQGTSDGLWKSLRRLWQSVSDHGNGGVVSMPVIGGGQSRMSQILPAQDSIRFTALSFMLHARDTPVCKELRIVVRPDDYDRMDRLEIQAFLDSLAAS